MGNGDAQGCAGSAFGIVGNDIENFNLELLAQVPMRREANRPKAMAPRASIR